MTIRNQDLSFEGRNIFSLSARIAALEAFTTRPIKFLKRNYRANELWLRLNDLDARCSALEADTVAPVVFDEHLPRSPQGLDLLDLHRRLVSLGN